MIDENNPAGRLYKILSESKSYKSQNQIIDVWSDVTGCERTPVSVTKAVIELYSLSQEVQSLIKMNKELNHKLYLAHFDRLEHVFFPLNLNGNWATPLNHLTEGVLTSLQFCAEELSKSYSEESLPEEELQDIALKANELFDSLYESSLPDSIRLILLEEIERIRSAIAMYKIHGARGIKQALQSTIGAVFANQEELKTVTPSDQDVMKKLGGLIDKIDSFSARAMKLKRILATTTNFILDVLPK